MEERGALPKQLSTREKEFIARLDQLKIPYRFEEYPDEVHSMGVWRPSLHKFITRLFRPVDHR
jgi:enterochelin esterase-like enzyme